MDCKICHQRPVRSEKSGVCESCYRKKRRRVKRLLCAVDGCKNRRDGRNRKCRKHAGKKSKTPPKVGVCLECKQEKQILAREMCAPCYRRTRRQVMGSGEWNKLQKDRAQAVAENNATEKDFSDLLNRISGKRT